MDAKDIVHFAQEKLENYRMVRTKIRSDLVELKEKSKELEKRPSMPDALLPEPYRELVTKARSGDFSVPIPQQQATPLGLDDGLRPDDDGDPFNRQEESASDSFTEWMKI